MELFTVANLVALLTLTVLEVVLGIDNVIFVTLKSQTVAPEKQARMRRLGILSGGVMRLIMLLLISLISKAESVLFALPITGHEVTAKDLFLIVGGLFLVAEAVKQLHHKTSKQAVEESKRAVTYKSFLSVFAAIFLMNAVFSIDSVLTAVGMVESVPVMMIAVIVAVVVMLFFADPVQRFVSTHHQFEILALACLLFIGGGLVVEGAGYHIPKGFVYGIIGFAFFVDLLQFRAERVKAYNG